MPKSSIARLTFFRRIRVRMSNVIGVPIQHRGFRNLERHPAWIQLELLDESREAIRKPDVGQQT